MNPIEITSLTKSYGAFNAIVDLSFSVPEGSICGLLGPNGAGKSSTFKCMTGLARPSSGTIAIAGGPVRPEMFEEVAFVPEKSALYDRLTGADHLEMMRRAYKNYDAARANKYLDLFGLDTKKKIFRLSKGQRTALALVLAMSFRPRVMILDEPASGLDPINQRAVLDILIDAAAQGAAIVFSSHQIGQVERAADRVVVIKRGTMVLEGEIDDLREREKVIEAVFAGPADGGAFATDPRIRRVERRGRTLRLHVRSGLDEIMHDVRALEPVSFQLYDQNLEELFFAAVEEPRPQTQEAD